MKKLLFISLCSLSMGMLNAMEEQPSEITTMENLPNELRLHVAQFLGNTIRETIANIVKLGQIDKAFNELLLKDRQAIRSIITLRYGKESIARAFIKALKKSDNLKQITPFFDLKLITPEDAHILFIVDPDWLKSVIYTWVINFNRKFDVKDPLNIKDYEALKAQYGAPQKEQFFSDLLITLISRTIVGLNKQYNGKTILDHAADIGADDQAISRLKLMRYLTSLADILKMANA